MRKLILLVMGIVFTYPLFSQTITITDNADLQPLMNVAIFCKQPSVSAITNSKGVADISMFKGLDSIYFNHVNYTSKMYNYRDLETLNFKISMVEKFYSLDELVISASRFEEKLKDIAQPVQIIRSKELAFISQQTTADVIQNTGNVMVQKSQLGGGSPIIRGFETNKVLMVIDGVRMNNAIYRGGHIQNILTLDNSIMSKMEILFGPGSVIYGSDALGGVMYFHTKTPILSDKESMSVQANALTRFSTACSEKTVHVDFNLGWKKFASLSSVSYSQFGDLRQGHNRNPFYGNWGKRTFYTERINGKDSMIVNSNPDIQKKSGYTQYDVLQKFLYQQSKNVSHEFNMQYSTSGNINRYDRLTEMSGLYPKFGEWYYGPQNRFFASYTLNMVASGGFYDNARIIFAYQKVEESRHNRKFNKTGLNSNVENLDIYTLNADFAKKVNRNEIRYGLDFWYNKVNSTAKTSDIVTGTITPLNTRYPDGGSTMQSIAGYITHSIEISKHLIVNDGIRVNYVQLHSKFNDKTFFPFPFDEVTQKNTAINGNLGLIYMPGADWRFTLVGSSGFRAPNVDDLSKVFESVPGSVIVPNPDLKPEYTYNLDLGMSKSINNTITIGINGFYTWYKQAITTQLGTFNGNSTIMYDGQLSQVTMNVNANEAYIYGMSGYLNSNFSDNFSITSTLNYTYGRIKTDTTEYPLDHIAPVFGKTSFNLKLKKLRGEFFVSYSGAKKSADYNIFGEDNVSFSADPIKGYLPAWYTLNIRTAYQFNKYLQLQVAVENILDQNYRMFASNISAAGRNVSVSLRGTF